MFGALKAQKEIYKGFKGEYFFCSPGLGDVVEFVELFHSILSGFWPLKN
jgi:hypothetical protein